MAACCCNENLLAGRVYEEAHEALESSQGRMTIILDDTCSYRGDGLLDIIRIVGRIEVPLRDILSFSCLLIVHALLPALVRSCIHPLSGKLPCLTPNPNQCIDPSRTQSQIMLLHFLFQSLSIKNLLRNKPNCRCVSERLPCHAPMPYLARTPTMETVGMVVTVAAPMKEVVRSMGVQRSWTVPWKSA